MRYLLVALSFVVTTTVFAQKKKFVANYDESKIKTFTLPNVFGSDEIKNASEWKAQREEILRTFEKEVYGRAPAPCPITSKLISTKEDALGGKALRREIDVYFGDKAEGQAMRLLIYTPKTDKPAAAFLTLNFQGNHSVDPDPSISLSGQWVRNRNDGSTSKNKPTDKARGNAKGRWPISTIVDRGYALVTIYYGDIDPDFDDGFKNGIHATLSKEAESIPADERWGSIAGWAYGLSRALDYLEKDDHIDGDRVAVFGHSRLGKTSLWAGASDPRFKMVISNNSGCGGAALSRRAIGETVGRINTVFPHWFCDNYLKYNENEDACPVDQHQLIALIAPRAVYVASAKEDRWADPKGEFLSALYAEPVFRLLGTDGFGVDASDLKQPAFDQPLKSGTIGYHVRSGGHDVKDFDWQQYLDFADRHLK